jgi:hypothetical protein
LARQFLPDWPATRIPEDNAGVALADLARHYQISIHPADLKSRHGNRIAFAENKPALFE